jgi:hypothetical protein
MAHTPLSLYLQDHLAGSTAGVALAKRFAHGNAGTRAGRTLALVAGEIEADRDTLMQLMADLGIPASRWKNTTAWLAERAARLKPNGRLRGEPLMQRVHELETLSLGITGKLALWEALRAAPAVAGLVDLAELEERAASQRERVETERMAFARAAFTSRRESPDSEGDRSPASSGHLP